jgi:hypothetical protein
MPRVFPGDRIRLLEMPNDPDPIPVGSEGVVIEVTEGACAQIMVEWRNIKRSLALIPGVDTFEIFESPAKGFKVDEDEPQ